MDRTAKVIKKIARYIGRSDTDGGDVQLAIDTTSDPSFPVSTVRTKGDQTTNTLIIHIEVKAYVSHMDRYKQNIMKAFSLIHVQWTVRESKTRGPG